MTATPPPIITAGLDPVGHGAARIVTAGLDPVVHGAARIVTAGLDPVVHGAARARLAAWAPGSSPGVTNTWRN